MALPRRKAVAEALVSTEPPDVIPDWAMSSVIDFLLPFVRGEGPDVSDFLRGTERNFLQEIEVHLKLPLTWAYGVQGAWESLGRRMQTNPTLLVDVLDYALQNVLLGHSYQSYQAVVAHLNRALQGTPFRAVPIDGTVNYRLEQRTDPTASAARQQLAATQTPEAKHLAEAWNAAYGRSPNPGHAYGQALKAVEHVAILTVLPNDGSATLGKVIGALRAAPADWEFVLARDAVIPTGIVGSVEVLIGMLDLLWKNQTDRHAPTRPVQQAEAEMAVHLAIVLVEVFRSGALTKR